MRMIPPLLLRKLNNKHQTPYNNSEPKMNISLTRARSSIMDSSYFTVETIRTKAGISDISIALQRLVPYGPPNSIYEIHIDNGIGKTTIRKYPDKRKDGWQEQFEIGPTIAVAIAFDGRWIRNSKSRWQIVTDEKPYIFYVKPNGQLFTRLWDNEEELLLAENVKKVKAIRGWKSQVIGTDDHGVIAAYIKNNGKVYYRNLCEQEDGKIVWEPEREITEATGISVNLNLFITNDYRTGIIVENSQGKVKWFITSRNWAGMAIASDKILSRNNVKVKFIETTKYKVFEDEKITAGINISTDLLYASSFNKFLEIENIDDGEGNFGRVIRFKTSFEIFDLDIQDFSVMDNRGVRYNPESITMIDDRVYQAEFYNFNNAKGELLFKCFGLYAKNAAGFGFNEFENTFNPINLVPIEIPPPEVINIKNTGDKKILIEFDRELVGEVSTSLSAFTITSIAWKDVFKDTEITEAHEISDIKRVSENKIELNINPLTRLRRTKKVIVNYDNTKGLLFGESDPVESFNYEFTPDIDIILDPATREKIELSNNIDISFIKIDYRESFANDKITAKPDISVEFINVKEINP